MSETVKHNSPLEGWRFKLIYLLMGGIFAFYGIRLLSLQILNPAIYVDAAIENRTTTLNLPAPRGLIYDRNGILLARNVASYNLVITPADLPGDPEEPATSGAIQSIYRQLSVLTGIPVSNGVIDENTPKLFTPCQTDLGITQMVYIGSTIWPYKPLRIKCNIDEKTAMVIK